MRYSEHEEWSHKLGGKPVKLFVALGLTVVPGGLAVWLYMINNVLWFFRSNCGSQYAGRTL